MAENRHPVLIRMDRDVLAQLDRLAQQEERTRNDYIRLILKHHVAQSEKPTPLRKVHP